MLTGIGLQDLAREIERVEQAKHDLVAPTTKLWMHSKEHESGENSLQVEVDGDGTYGISDVAHGQIAARLDIPKKYYDRMKVEAPDLLTTNVNAWFRKKPESRMVRTLDGRCRAFLSDRYRPLDNFMVAQAALPVLAKEAQAGNLSIKSSQVTEKRMYIQAVYPKLQAVPKVGDVIQAGLVLSNSEVGHGAFSVEMLLYRLACSNGMIRGHSFRRHHVGKRIDSGDEVNQDFYRTETVEADNKAFMMKVEDTVNHSFNPEAFQQEILRLAVTTQQKLQPKKLEDQVKVVTKKMSMTDTETEGVLTNLFEDGDFTQYGLANAVTALAHNAEDYDKSIEYERKGGRVIDLNRSEWQSITNV